MQHLQIVNILRWDSICTNSTATGKAQHLQAIGKKTSNKKYWSTDQAKLDVLQV